MTVQNVTTARRLMRDLRLASSFPDTRRGTIKARHPPIRRQPAQLAGLKVKIKYVNEQQMRAAAEFASPTMEQRCGSDKNNERTSLLLFIIKIVH